MRRVLGTRSVVRRPEQFPNRFQRSGVIGTLMRRVRTSDMEETASLHAPPVG
jgi:hypothetical protein